MSRICVIASTLISAFSLLGCNSGFASSDIVDQMPTGTMNGEPWTASTAYVLRDVPGTSGQSIAKLETGDVEQCAASAVGPITEIMFMLPQAPGEYPLQIDRSDPSRSQVVTFYDGETNQVATDGLIVIDSIDDHQVTGGIIAMVGSSEINGRFTAEICE